MASSSFTWSGGISKVLTVSATVSNRLGPVSVTYTVAVQRYEEQQQSRQVPYSCDYACEFWNGEEYVYQRNAYHCGCCDTCYSTEYYMARVPQGVTSMSVAHTLLLLPTGVTVYAQPASTYTSASTTNVAVTLQLVPAVTVTSGHLFSAEKTSVSESGSPRNFNLPSKSFLISRFVQE